MKAALKKANMPDTPTARLILGKILAENTEAEAEKKVALAEAYRCGYEAGVVAERAECAALAEKTICDKHIPTGVSIYGTRAAKAIRARTTP